MSENMEYADHLFNQLQDANAEITRLQADNEALRARVAGLESVLQEIADRDRVRQYEGCPDCFHKCTRETGCRSMRFSRTGDLANGALLGVEASAIERGGSDE